MGGVCRKKNYCSTDVIAVNTITSYEVWMIINDFNINGCFKNDSDSE